MARGAPPAITDSSPYALISTRPLHVLAFLTPLVLLYEIGSFLYLTGSGRGVETIGARGMLGSFFQTFGVAGLHLPPVTLIVVLLAWHVMLRDPWRVRPRVILAMGVESALWALPLLILGLALALGGPRPAAGAGQALSSLPWQARAAVSIGAGLYEELLFRLILITALHFAFVDLLGMKSRAGYVVAAAASAVAFAFYHNVTLADAAQARLLVFYALAGLYFGAIFVVRGFGVVVAAHAAYDLIALLVFPGEK